MSASSAAAILAFLLHLAEKGYDVVLLEAHKLRLVVPPGAMAGKLAPVNGKIRIGSRKP